jgi:phosphopantothenoylcysteine decarboxylase/phosphopantothenate--cysteine ligase
MEEISVLKDRRLLLGVTGGIAAYKACTLASRLTQAGADVDVVMTEAGTRFVAPLTFQSLTGRPVYTSMWGTTGGDAGEGPPAMLPTHVVHIGLAEAAELIVIAPATANTLAKLAHGIADNLLTSLALGARCPILAAPAMDGGMWANPATQANLALLNERGVLVAGPTAGRMASGLEGEGRMVEPEELLGHIRLALGRRGPLAGRKIVVSAGPTREELDPVRFLSNAASGRQGFALAQAALDRGAAVMLVAGPTELATPVGAERVDITTAEEMSEAVISAVDGADALLMAAAVADYRPTEVALQKLKKSDKPVQLELERTQDVLSAVAVRWAGTGLPRVVVGFAAETEALLDNARQKLAAKNLDLIVANDVTSPDAGFAAETNRVVLLGRDGEAQELPLMSKAAVADAVLDRIVHLLEEKQPQKSRSKKTAKKATPDGVEE